MSSEKLISIHHPPSLTAEGAKYVFRSLRVILRKDYTEERTACRKTAPYTDILQQEQCYVNKKTAPHRTLDKRRPCGYNKYRQGRCR